MSDRTPFPVDLAALCQPISAERPAGEWLRYEGTYDQIQDARREDDSTLPQGIWKTTQKRANWQAVSRLCQEALRTRSKDLQIAAWLLEAWVHTYGYRGLTAGLRLIHGLCAAFWEDLFPALDPEDPSFRTAPVEWVDQKIPLQLKLCPLTRPPEGDDARAYSFSDWELCLHRSQASRAEEDPGGVTESRFLASASLTPRGVLIGAAEELAEAQAQIAAVEGLLDERLGWQSSSLIQLRDTVQSIRQLLNQLTGQVTGTQGGADEGADWAAEPGVPEDEPMAGSQDEGGGGVAARGPIRSRAEAYQRLQEAADYLLRTEPHSPTPYLVRRAVAWGNKSLGELLAEVVGSGQSLQEIYQLLAIRGPE
jgi:type VI secretion system protein ImpA